MGEIVSFSKTHSRAGQKMTTKERNRALLKGTIEYYRCNSCDARIEVIDDNKPIRCPECLRRITW